MKRHFYYSMKNCTSPDDLRRRRLTIIDHYQVSKGCIKDALNGWFLLEV